MGPFLAPLLRRFKMGVTLYRQGITSKVGGIDCELQVFNENSFMHNVTSGEWFFSPKEAYADKPSVEEVTEVAEEIITITEPQEAVELEAVGPKVVGREAIRLEMIEQPVEVEPEVVEENEVAIDVTDGKSEKEIRAMAKEAGISSSHNRKIDTLKEMLNNPEVPKVE